MSTPSSPDVIAQQQPNHHIHSAGNKSESSLCELQHTITVDLSHSQIDELAGDENNQIYAQTRTGLRERSSNASLGFRRRIDNSRGQPSPRLRLSSEKQNIVSELAGNGDVPLDFDFAPVMSERSLIRRDIAKTTLASRDRFLVETKNFWLPLLPPNNYVQKLVSRQAGMSQSLSRIINYEEIENQPGGVEATMKPYQLSGLSFLVFLYKNGLNGILGDEMGLGKTLQTLSLIQYLKENDAKIGTGRQQRPFLVVCPLSVLSNWMAEVKKWTPSLKAIRFHGPEKERNRLKKIVVGDMDFQGRLTSQAKSKIKSRKNAAMKHIISLDTDSEDDQQVGIDLVVTTYECYRAEQSWIKKAFVWRYVVLDEGHTVKNHQSLVSQSLQGLQSEYRLILTGTPLQNNLSELWSLLHWLYPEVFTKNTIELFDSSFNLSKGKYSSNVVDSARKLLELIMLRRMKTSAGVDLNLPPKTDVLLFVPLSPMQRFWYTRMITKADLGILNELFKGARGKEEASMKASRSADERMKIDSKVSSGLQGDLTDESCAWKDTKEILEQTVLREQESRQVDGPKRSDWQLLMNLLMQLRKVCNHPYQILNAEPDPYHTGDHVITASGKFIVLEKLIVELVVRQRKKILIFSGFTKMLDLVEELLALRGDGSSFRSARIEGSTPRARRNLAIRMFNNLDSDYRVMLISTRAGGLGINLAGATELVMLDQDWNPQITLQAEARAHRIGQKNSVTVYRLVSQGTVEEQMMGRIQKKLYLSAKVTEAMEDIHTKFGVNSSKKKGGRSPDEDENIPQLSTGQLITLVRRGASALSKEQVDVDEMLSWDWETTVSKCKDQPTVIDVDPDVALDEEAERKWLSEIERVEASVFDGKLLNRGKYVSNKDISAEYFSKAERRMGKNTTVMVNGFAISKESMHCGEWEAVPTLAGKDPRLADVRRAKRASVEPQSHCQVCIDGGELYCCQICPRSYHFRCLSREFQSKAKGWQFNCPQHQCFDCSQKTTDAGGMLYRCRWCERAYCEDCLDFEKAVLLGDNLLEFELLGYPEMVQAFYVQCAACTSHFSENPEDKLLCDELAAGFERTATHQAVRAESLRPDSLTDAPTKGTTTEVNTPIWVEDEDFEAVNVKTKKRKAGVKASLGSSKRSKSVIRV